MSTGIPLNHLNNKSILAFQKDNHSLFYKVDSNRLFRKYTLTDSSSIVKAIRFLARSHESIHARKINRIIKRIFNLNLTSKNIQDIYYLIFKDKIAITLLDNTFPCMDSFVYNTKLDNILLVNEPLLDLNKILAYINSFSHLKLNKSSLALFKNSTSHIEKSIAFLVEDFFNNNKYRYKNLHQLISFINSNLKQMGIDYKSTCKSQKKIFLRLFKS
ncbi:hypothetical protein [Borrelia turcica]|nr:hypothetical protein [Borrelia turcica]